MNLLERILLLALLLFCYLSVTQGQGRLLEPPARGTTWRMGFNTYENYDDHMLNCGGGTHHEREYGYECGVCGDPPSYARPRPNENGGKYSRSKNGNLVITRVYDENAEIDIRFKLESNHLGYAEFSICRLENFDDLETEECFDEHPLHIRNVPDGEIDACQHQPYEDKIVVCRDKNVYHVKAELPPNLSCDLCVLRWHYRTAKDWGTCADGDGRLGCGPQEIFRGCSDITIVKEKDVDVEYIEEI